MYSITVMQLCILICQKYTTLRRIFDAICIDDTYRVKCITIRIVSDHPNDTQPYLCFACLCFEHVTPDSILTDGVHR